MSQFVDLSTMHLFQKSLISSPDITSTVTCMLALEWQDFFSPWYTALIKNMFLYVMWHAHFLFKQTLQYTKIKHKTCQVLHYLTFWLVVVLLSVQDIKQNIRVTLSKKKVYLYFWPMFSDFHRRSVLFWRYRYLSLRSSGKSSLLLME